MIAVRASYDRPWIAYGSWFVWRWLIRFPEDAVFRDVEVKHKEAR